MPEPGEGLSPLEVMAKAHWEANRHDVPRWEGLTLDSREDDLVQMRAALLALAECELPLEIPLNQYVSMTTNEVFKAMLRAIANEGKE